MLVRQFWQDLQRCGAFIMPLQGKMKDDNQIIPQPAIYTEFFHRTFANACTM
jgi:hypothetical protein